MTAPPPRMKLGELLLRAGLLNEHQLKSALTEQQKWGGQLGDILVRMSYITEETLVRALSKQSGVPIADLSNLDAIPREVLDRVPANVCADSLVLPLAVADEGRTLLVAMSDPLSIPIHDELRSVTGGAKIVGRLAGPNAIAKAVAKLYQGETGGEEFETTDEAFKMVDAQGRTLVKSIDQIEAEAKAKGLPGLGLRPAAPAAPSSPPAAAPRAPAPARAAPPSPTSGTPAEQLRTLEAQQQREVAALKVLVELLIEKQVFSREEYLARVRR